MRLKPLAEVLIRAMGLWAETLVVGMKLWAEALVVGIRIWAEPYSNSQSFCP
jgi:hypothetical protein